MSPSKDKIKNALQRFGDGNLADNARHLLKALGYRSERTLSLEPNTADGFIEHFDSHNILNRERGRLSEWESIDFLFQLTEAEITQSAQTAFHFEDSGVDQNRYESYLFFALKLQNRGYTRTQLSDITREINRLLLIPAMVMFQHGDALTFAVIDRRLHKRDESKDVLEKVTLIKDIVFTGPHRAHIDILFDLSLGELHRQHSFTDFPGLHQAWKKTLDTEVLNKQFYQRLFNWFVWAVEESKFPVKEKRILKPEQHIIRLITRLLFIWFIKEKRLVADELFDETEVARLLKDYNRETGDSYYRAVLQNLFFATLNTEIEKRDFSTEKNATHRNFSRYRYKRQISHPDKLLELFAQTPFINGGLFDCLDSEEATAEGGYRIDCFSDKHYKRLSIPNRLFFDEDDGLFPLLKHYKFTVEENTPIEQEVALDPELLGKVFENLLAAYNPETGESARKQTGSYYTPRPIVDYMVEEALVATLAGKVPPTDGDASFWEERLRYLLDYAKAFDDASEWFDGAETDGLVRGISELKILDPAVGSGAFPMGVLHKLTLALRRLDPDNSRWEQLQKERAIQRAEVAFDTKDDRTRREELVEIDETFKRYRDSDFGRKLYLIQNSIFGVDIQSIACQIAKLRFFISLAIEQVPDKDAENFGIKPLPNLETRFVAANTLIGLEGERTLISPNAKALEQALADNRERHFHATTRPKKLACKREDKKLRRELATELRHIGMPDDDAEKIVHWDLYDQSASAEWFDSEWMFGVKSGFDVVIGNPPYIKEYTFKQAFDGLRESPYYQGKMDIWYMFACEGLDIAKDGKGLVTFIAQNNWVTSYGASKMRDKVITDVQILSLIDFGSFKIFESGIQTMIMIFQKNTDSESYAFDYRRLHGSDVNINDVELLLNMKSSNKAEYLNPTIKRSDYIGKSLTFSNPELELILEKISSRNNFRLNPNKEVAQGIVYPQDRINKASKDVLGDNFNVGDGIFVLSEKEKDQMALTNKELNLMKPSYTTKELQRYRGNPKNQECVIYTDSGFKDERKIENYPNIKRHLNQFRRVITSDNGPYGLHRARNEHFFLGEKIISVRKCASPTFTYVDFDCYVAATFYVIKTKRLDQKYLTGLLNSRLIAFWLKHRGKMQGTNYQIDKQPLLELPLLLPSSEQQASVATLVNQILVVLNADLEADITTIEKKIDQIVYLLYDLTLEEIAIVEENAV